MRKVTDRKRKKGVITPLLESVIKKMLTIVDTSMLTEQEKTMLDMVLKGIPTAAIADSQGLTWK